MATTRTPLPPTEPQELFHSVGMHVYLLRYPKGQEDLAREYLYLWVRNRDLAFEWADAATMAERLPDPPVADDPFDDTAAAPLADPLDFSWWGYFSATVWVGCVAAPWVGLVIAYRWWKGE